MASYPVSTPSPLETARLLSSASQSLRDRYDGAADMARGAGQGDCDSFMRIYDHFMPRVCLYLRGLGSPDAVSEELAQEALLRLWQRAAMYDPNQSSVGTWLFRIARNLHIDRVRREPGWVQLLEDVQASLDDDFSVRPVSVEDHVDHLQLQQRIATLPAMQAQLMRMSYLESKTHQEIAAQLDMPLGTVKSHLRRTFLRLQSQMRGGA